MLDYLRKVRDYSQRHQTNIIVAMSRVDYIDCTTFFHNVEPLLRDAKDWREALDDLIESQAQAKEILTQAREILVTKGWTQEKYARDKAGKQCEIEFGSCFCALGAIILSARGSEYFKTACRVLEEEINWSSIPSWNDASSRTKEEVLAAFEGAIKRC